MALCFYALCAFLPSVPGRARHADLLIKTSPDGDGLIGGFQVGSADSSRLSVSVSLVLTV